MVKEITSKKLRVAILGCGKMGLNHVRAIKSSNRAVVVGIADPLIQQIELNPLIADIKKFKCPKDMLDVLRPDVVHICTPPDTHAKLARFAIERNANIYVEKPFTLCEADASEVIALAATRNVKVCAGHQVLFEEPARKAEEYLKEIGSIVHIESYFSFKKVRRNLSQVEQLIDILPHPVYTILHFLKKSTSIEEDAGLEIVALDAQPQGEVRALLKWGNVRGIVIVSLQGRPVESYLRIVGTNGTVCADFVHGTVVTLVGPCMSTITILQNPYKQSGQILWETTKSLGQLAFKRRRGYPGLFEIIKSFYESILENTQEPLTQEAILATVGLCERMGEKLREAEINAEQNAEELLKKLAHQLVCVDPEKKTIIVTGGTGFLGKMVSAHLRNQGWPVRIISRRMPPFSQRTPGVEYVTVDLAQGIPKFALDGASAIVHCAAETSGDIEAHKRNSVDATSHLLEAAASAGIKRFIHISSLAVLKPGGQWQAPLNESAQIDMDNMSRGPYVWGKAQSEKILISRAKEIGLQAKIIRPGPLVDFNDFEAPGRLGREIGSCFIVMGNRKSKMSVCDVQTVSKVISYYLTEYNSSPPVLNLIEPLPLTRKDLVDTLLKTRRGLKALYVPSFAVSIISVILYALQKVVFPYRKPFNIASAFSSEKYSSDLAKEIIRRAEIRGSIPSR